MDYLGEGEMLTNRDVYKFVHKNIEKQYFCAYGTFLESFISAHDTWEQLFTCGVYIFVQYSYHIKPHTCTVYHAQYLFSWFILDDLIKYFVPCCVWYIYEDLNESSILGRLLVGYKLVKVINWLRL
jgi:hypothetical protein